MIDIALLPRSILRFLISRARCHFVVEPSALAAKHRMRFPEIFLPSANFSLFSTTLQSCFTRTVTGRYGRCRFVIEEQGTR